MAEYIEEIFTDIIDIVRRIRSNKKFKIFQGELRRLTMAQIHVLNYVYDNEKGTMGELSSYAKVKMPTMTDTVNRLVKSGYVKRSHSEKDRRNVVITITAKGKDLIVSHRKTNMMYLANFLESLSDAEKNFVKNFLQKIKQNIEKEVEN